MFEGCCWYCRWHAPSCVGERICVGALFLLGSCIDLSIVADGMSGGVFHFVQGNALSSERYSSLMWERSFDRRQWYHLQHVSSMYGDIALQRLPQCSKRRSQSHCAATAIIPITTCEIIVTVLSSSLTTSSSATPAKSLAARSGCQRRACLRKIRRLTSPG